MNYNVTHVTRYTYRTTVELTTGLLRLKPVSREGQVLESFSLTTEPPCLPPTERVESFCSINRPTPKITGNSPVSNQGCSTGSLAFFKISGVIIGL